MAQIAITFSRNPKSTENDLRTALELINLCLNLTKKPLEDEIEDESYGTRASCFIALGIIRFNQGNLKESENALSEGVYIIESKMKEKGEGEELPPFIGWYYLAKLQEKKNENAIKLWKKMIENAEYAKPIYDSYIQEARQKYPPI